MSVTSTQACIQEILEFEVPENLYVPSPPLWIESKGFRGPLDLLWYLIKKQNINILDIPMALIAAQYVQYIKMMTAYRFEIAPDYLVMAVRLIQIKSQMLLPKKQEAMPVEEEDPRALLIQQLVDYEDVQKTAQKINTLPRWERDVWPIQIHLSIRLLQTPEAKLEFNDLTSAYKSVKKNLGFHKKHEVTRLHLSLSERMHEIFSGLEYNVRQDFSSILVNPHESLELAVSFQAILELAKNNQIVLEQLNWEDLLWLKRVVK